MEGAGLNIAVKEAPRSVGHGAAKGDGGFALRGNHKHSEIPKQGDSGSRFCHALKTAPARPREAGAVFEFTHAW